MKFYFPCLVEGHAWYTSYIKTYWVDILSNEVRVLKLCGIEQIYTYIHLLHLTKSYYKPSCRIGFVSVESKCSYNLHVNYKMCNVIYVPWPIIYSSFDHDDFRLFIHLAQKYVKQVSSNINKHIELATHFDI